MSRFENRRWLVIPVSKIDDINFSEVHEPNAESLRKSIDGTQTFVKYEINIIEKTYTETFENIPTGESETITVEAGVYGRPSVYSTDYTEYNHADILELLATKAWSEELKK